MGEELTLVPAATSPTPLEPSMLPRGRLRLSPTTTEDTTGSDTEVSDTVTDTATAMATDSTVKILLGCLRSGCNYAADILSLDWVKMDLKLAQSTKSGIIVSCLIREVYTAWLW